ncbi:CG8152 [Drosophila busckii]|uniref:CG8152 n=1 Tax=Drosophila busckii TaxID=30019 RepID=A0A0M4EDI6_DROBS|nr:G patch domain and ankyrin repeat-containing protein 1 homolog [Drosophila busckii]ALC41977.1 CG8152 [Drosophila busckii]
MDSTGLELHPNWIALTTLHVPLKRFVRAGETVEASTDKAEKHKIEGVSSEEVQQFYKEVLETPPIASQPVRKSTRRPKEKPAPQLPYESNNFFRLATGNNVEGLSRLAITEEQQLNACDKYGWSGLMMAACEGAADAVEWLLRAGANTELADKSGNTALTLARKKGHTAIVEMLEMIQASQLPLPIEEATTTNTATKPFYCEVCQRDYKESTWHAHQTSTVHQFNMKSLPAHKLQKFNISLKNRGLQLMVKQGWDREHGLGPTHSGRLYPIKTVLRKQRTGLGIEQSPARVTHFEAFDTNATKHRYRNTLPQQPNRNRNDMRREKLREWKRERRLRNELS